MARVSSKPLVHRRSLRDPDRSYNQLGGDPPEVGRRRLGPRHLGRRSRTPGPTTAHVKHISTVDIEPISFEFGLSGAKAILVWIQDSWNREPARHSGQVTHADFNPVQPTFRNTTFFNALISETSFPTLDGASKDAAAIIKCKIQPESMVTTKVRSRAAAPSWTATSASSSSRRCGWPRRSGTDIDGIPDNAKYTNKIEGFTIKQGIKKLYTGEDRFPQIEPTKIEFPNLTCTISLEYADEILDWYDAVRRQGAGRSERAKTGSLRVLESRTARRSCSASTCTTWASITRRCCSRPRRSIRSSA